MERREFLCCIGCAGVASLVGCRTPPTPEGPYTGPVRPEDFSVCGIDCKSCDVRKATAEGDQEARIRAVEAWTKTAQQHWGMQTLDPDMLDCRGCRVAGHVQHKGCGRCPIRPCAKGRGLASCGLCPEWQTCERLTGVFADEPAARGNLRRVAQRRG